MWQEGKWKKSRFEGKNDFYVKYVEIRVSEKHLSRVEIPGILLHMLLRSLEADLGWKYNFVIHENIGNLSTMSV